MSKTYEVRTSITITVTAGRPEEAVRRAVDGMREAAAIAGFDLIAGSIGDGGTAFVCEAAKADDEEIAIFYGSKTWDGQERYPYRVRVMERDWRPSAVPVLEPAGGGGPVQDASVAAGPTSA